MFQFHSGSIQTPWNSWNYLRTSKFQFHSGSIQTDVVVSFAESRRDVSIPLWFDSNMLNVCECLDQVFVLIPLWFDSNYGGGITNFRGSIVFQFHSGSIQTFVKTQFVRLQQLFQFHSGSIQTDLNLRNSHILTAFQFHSGSIQTKSWAIRTERRSRVSIPLWFDSNCWHSWP